MSVSSCGDAEQQLSRLVYISTAVRLMCEADHRELLDQSRAFNQAHRITGMLLYKDQSFLQLLEGPKDEVDSLYRKICKDERHVRAKTLLQEHVSERLFERWSMGFRSLDSEPAVELAAYSDFMNADFDVSRLTESAELAMRLLLHFRAYS